MTAFNSLHAAPGTPQLPFQRRAEDPVQVNAQFGELIRRQTAMSREQLNALHRKLLGPKGIFVELASQIERMGRQAPLLDDVGRLNEPRSRQAEKTVAFVLSQVNRRSSAYNPFRGRTRNYLCCVVFCDPSEFTLVERYAAYEALRQRDSDLFIKLIATTRGVQERRIVFRGLLEHFDSLLPLEKCFYPPTYRDAQQQHLDREEEMYGPLILEDSLTVLLQKNTPHQLLKQIQSRQAPQT